MKVEAVSDGENSSGSFVLNGLARYSRHEWHINHFIPDLTDCDIVYVHAGVCLNEISPRLKNMIAGRRDLKWAAGLRGEVNYKRWAVDWNPTTALKDYVYLLDVISCSNSHYLQEMQKFGLNAHLCPSGVNPDIFKQEPFPEKFTIGFVGAADHGEKNYSLFESLPFKNKLVAAGDIKHEDMPNFYNGISVLVCCSLSEGSPVPPKEAALCGRPTAAFPVGDLTDWLPKELIVGDRAELIGILKLLENNGLINELGSECQDKVNRYTFPNIAPLYDAMLESCF